MMGNIDSGVMIGGLASTIQAGAARDARQDLRVFVKLSIVPGTK
jgi:hypothetical protein